MLIMTSVPPAVSPGTDGTEICINCSNHSFKYICSTHEEYVVYVYIYTPLAVLGVLLNILNIIVFTRSDCRSSTLTFLVLLAVSDMMYLSFVVPMSPLRCLPKRTDLSKYVSSYYEAYVYLPLVNICGTISNWATVVLALDRCIHIERSKYCIRASTMSFCCQRFIVTAIIVGSFLINIPYFFYKTVNDRGYAVDSEFSKSQGFRVYNWIRMTIIKIVPILTVATCNAMLIKLLIHMNSQRKTLVPHSAQAKLQHQQIRISAMLISISVVFLVCHLIEPLSHSSLYGAIFGSDAVYSENHYHQIMVTNLLEMLGHGINFWFYCIFTPKFMQQLKNYLSCCPRRRSSAEGQLEDYNHNQSSCCNGFPKGEGTSVERYTMIRY